MGREKYYETSALEELDVGPAFKFLKSMGRQPQQTACGGESSKLR